MIKLVQDFFFENNFFPIKYSIDARNTEELRRSFYIYDYNKFFGVQNNLLNNEGAIKTIFFYITNLSKTYYDYILTLDDIEVKYFASNELTRRLISDTLEFFSRAGIDITNNSMFWTNFLRLLYSLYETILIDYLKFYLSFVRGKANALYFTSLKESSCSSSYLQQLEIYLTSIRKKFLSVVSINGNRALANFLSGYYSLLFDSVVDYINPSLLGVTVPEPFSFFYIYSEADRNALPVVLHLDELESSFKEQDTIVFKSSVSSVLSPSDNNIHFVNISSIIGTDLTHGLFNYLQT